jgi:hypothetical protein
MMRVKQRQTTATKRPGYVLGVDWVAVGGSERSSVVAKTTFLGSEAQVSLLRIAAGRASASITPFHRDSGP